MTAVQQGLSKSGLIDLHGRPLPNYYRLRIGGREIYEIDLLNGVRRIGGVDQLAGRRAALGL